RGSDHSATRRRGQHVLQQVPSHRDHAYPRASWVARAERSVTRKRDHPRSWPDLPCREGSRHRLGSLQHSSYRCGGGVPVRWPDNPTPRDLLVHREDMFDPVVIGVGQADAGYADATPVSDEEVTASGYNDTDAATGEVVFDAVSRWDIGELP